MNLRQQLDHAKLASDESAVEACIVRLRQQSDAESKLLLNLASAWLLTRRGDLAAAKGHGHEALRIAIDLGLVADEVVALNALGLNAMLQGELALGSEYYLRALERAIEHDLRRWVANISSNLSNLYAELGDRERALEHGQRAIEVYDGLGLRNDAAQTRGNLGNIYYMEREYERAIELYTQAFAVHREEGDREGVAFLATSLSGAYVLIGDIEHARQFTDIALQHQDLEVSICISIAYSHGEVLKHEGHPMAAADEFRRGLALATEAGFKAAMGGGHEHLMNIALATGDLAAYVEHSTAFHAIDKELRGREATRKIAELEQQGERIRREEELRRQRDVLNSMLPTDVAERVARGETVHDSYAHAVIMFVDIVHFTDHTSTMDPSDVVTLLHTFFSAIDSIVSATGLQKIKTIGDSYMAAVLTNTDPAMACRAAANCAIAIRQLSFEWPTQEPLAVRIGMHYGPVTAGVIGTDRLQYDVWGDTVNLASRMESTGEAGAIHVSAEFAAMLNDPVRVVARGQVDIKGKGLLTSYWIVPDAN